MNVHLILELPVLPPRQPSRLVEYLAMQLRRNDKEFQTFQATFLCTRMPTETFQAFWKALWHNMHFSWSSLSNFGSTEPNYFVFAVPLYGVPFIRNMGSFSFSQHAHRHMRITESRAIQMPIYYYMCHVPTHLPTRTRTHIFPAIWALLMLCHLIFHFLSPKSHRTSGIAVLLKGPNSTENPLHPSDVHFTCLLGPQGRTRSLART